MLDDFGKTTIDAARNINAGGRSEGRHEDIVEMLKAAGVEEHPEISAIDSKPGKS